MSFKLLILAGLIAMAYATRQYYSKGHGGSDGYGDGYGPRRVLVPVYNYGPDNARYRLTSRLYDNYVYQRTHLDVDRYPGGVSYDHNLNGYGADIKVHFNSYPSPVSYKKPKY